MGILIKEREATSQAAAATPKRLEYGRTGLGPGELTVLLDDDRRLLTVCDPVPLGTDCSELIRDMNVTLLAKRGVGLAAPQVGVFLRIIVGAAKRSDGKGMFAWTLINPVRTNCGAKRVGAWEHCLSQPGRKAFVKRYDRVEVTAYNDRWELVRLRFSGFEARVLQHEMDHLDGVLMTDKRT